MNKHLSGQLSIVLPGHSQLSPGQIISRSVEDCQIALGMSVGTTTKPNEDMAGVGQLGSDTVLAVADGHWGAEASELAVNMALEMVQAAERSPVGNEMRGRLFMLFEQINESLLELGMQSPGAPTPETTLVVCYIRSDSSSRRLYWASFGDSYLFFQRANRIEQLNTLNCCWLGALSMMSERAHLRSLQLNYPSGNSGCYVGVADGLESGMTELTTGDVLFLCTDGLMECAVSGYHLSSDDLQLVLSEPHSLEKAVAALIETAIEHGAIDNMACILMKVP